MEIGEKLKAARGRAGLTQEQAALSLHVSRQTVSNWENGRSWPDIASVVKISDLYSVSLDELLKEEKTVKQTYVEYLSESTDVVKSKNRLGRVILAAAWLLLWAGAEIALWFFSPAAAANAFQWVLLPLAALLLSALWRGGQTDGRTPWALPFVLGAMMLLVPASSTAAVDDVVYHTFQWPNFPLLAAGIAASLLGLGAGRLLRKKAK